MKFTLIQVAALWGSFAVGSLCQMPLTQESLATLETFVLAEDREAFVKGGYSGDPVLRRLRCLHLLNEGRLGELDAELAAWSATGTDSADLSKLMARRALVGFESDPGRTWEFLDREFPPVSGAGGRLSGEGVGAIPTGQIRGEVFEDQKFLAASRASGEKWLRDLPADRAWSLPWADLTERELELALERVDRPDAPGLTEAVLRELSQASEFGARKIHNKLTTAQLDRLAAAFPPLLERKVFVQVALDRLSPNPDVDVKRFGASRGAWLDRLLAFSDRLPGRWDGFRARVLFHRLENKRALGELREPDFKAYLEAARVTGLSARPFFELRRSVDFDSGLRVALQAVSASRHDALVRALLLEFLGSDSSPADYSRWIAPEALERLSVEAQLLAGREPGPWLDEFGDPEFLRSVEQRVELRFPADRKVEHGVDEPVVIELVRKAVSELYVEVYQVDAEAYYREKENAVPANLDLSGHEPLREMRLAFEDSPFVRVRERFEFPEFAGPGVFLVRFAGEGLVSHTVIRKGDLSFEAEPTVAGQRLRVFDERGRPVSGAEALIGGQAFAAEPNGDILIPFRDSEGADPIILRGAGRVGRGTLPALGEIYRLTLNGWLDTEQQVQGMAGRMLLRSGLLLADRPVSIDWVEQPVVVVSTVSRDGVASSFRVEDPDWSDSMEGVFEIPIPELSGDWQVKWTGEVGSLLSDTPIRLESAPVTFTAPGVHDHGSLSGPLLSRGPDGYLLEVLGRNGEPVSGEVLKISCEHPVYPTEISTRVRTDGSGQVRLGELDGILSFKVHSEAFGSQGFQLRAPLSRWPSHLHLERGEPFVLPVAPQVVSAQPPMSLLELRGGLAVSDLRSSLRWEPGGIACAGLDPGDYELWLPASGNRVSLRVTERADPDGSRSAARRLEPSPRPGLRIEDLGLRASTDETGSETGTAQFVVQLDGAGPSTRVHVTAGFFAPSDSLPRALRPEPLTAPRSVPLGPTLSDHVSERALGSEERYILARRFAERFAGSLLERPGLVLQPWVREEATDNELSGRGSRKGLGGGAGPGGAAGKRSGLAAASLPSPTGSGTGFPDRSFLAGPGVVLANLRPDSSGRVVLDPAVFGGRGWIEVCALDGDQVVGAQLFVDSQDPPHRDLRHQPDPGVQAPSRLAYDFRLLRPGDPLPEGPPAPDRWILIDSLEGTFERLLGLCSDPELEKFAFLTDWPDQDRDRKAALYGEFACHGLNLFLKFHDAAFFAEVVEPYLSNKLQKTFLDRWLLDEDVERFLEPAAFAKLGLIERALLTGKIQSERFVGFWGEQRARSIWTQATRGKRVRSVMQSGWLDPVQRAESLLVGRLRSGGYSGGGGGSLDGAINLGDLALGGNPGPISGGREVQLRSRQRSFHRAPGRTKIWNESYWWRRALEAGPPPATGHDYWADYAQRDRSQPFLSTELLGATGGADEVLCALAVLDLDWQSREPGAEATPADTGLLLVREFLPVSSTPLSSPVLLAREWFRADWSRAASTRNRLARSSAPESSDSLEPGVLFGLRWVVTNPSPIPFEGELTLALPDGAIMIDGGRGIRNQSVRVEPWGQVLSEAWMYFPSEGTYRLPAAHLTSEQSGLASFEPQVLDVRLRPDRVRVAWPEIAEAGSPEEVVEHLSGLESLARVDWRPLLPRLTDPEMWDMVLAQVEPRAGLIPDLWRPAIFHRDAVRSAEFLSTQSTFLEHAGPYLDSPLLRIDPFGDLNRSHLEFAPIHNPRSQRVDGAWRIESAELARELERFLWELAHKPALDASDRLRLCDLFLASERVADAIEQLELVGESPVAKLQRDYLAAWLALAQEDLVSARAAAESHANHPVPRWRNRFASALAVVDQAEAGTGRLTPEQLAGDSNGAGALRAPALELSETSGGIALRHGGPGVITVGFYPVDVERRFSEAPFVGSGPTQTPFVMPAAQLTVDSAASPVDGLAEQVIALPADLRDRATMVVARNGSLVRRTLVKQSGLAVQVTEAFGRLTVRDAGNDTPLARVYVKVYRRDSKGGVHFHKDGTTDILGRFDYASVTPPPEAPAERYAILVIHDRLGAEIRDVAATGS